MKTLKQYFTNPDYDLLKLNPFVRKVNKINTSWDTHNVPWRKLYDYSMIVMLDGKLNFSCEGEEFSLQVGEIMVMPPFILHKEFLNEGERAKYYVINFDWFYDSKRAEWRMQDMYLNSCQAGIVRMKEKPEYMIRDDNAGFIRSPLVLRVKNINVLLEILQKMYEIDISSMVQPLAIEKKVLIKAYFLEIMSRLIIADGNSENKRYSVQINQFIEFVMENYSSDIDLSKQAIRLGLSPNFFQKIFKEEIGMTPFAYLRNVRMEEAKILLSQDISVHEVAVRVGYDDPLYFGKVFKKQTGISPAHYKKTIVESADGYKM